MTDEHTKLPDRQLPPALTYSMISAGVSITVYVIYNIFICGCP